MLTDVVVTQRVGTTNTFGLHQYSGAFTPVLTAIAGISGSITPNNAWCEQNGFLVTCTIDVSFTANDSVIQFGIDNPIAAGFTNTSQASLKGGVLTTSSPNVADGNLVNAQSDNTNQRVNITANATVGSGNYIIRCSYVYEVQP